MSRSPSKSLLTALALAGALPTAAAAQGAGEAAVVLDALPVEGIVTAMPTCRVTKPFVIKAPAPG